MEREASLSYIQWEVGRPLYDARAPHQNIAIVAVCLSMVCHLPSHTFFVDVTIIVYGNDAFLSIYLHRNKSIYLYTWPVILIHT